MTFGIYDWTYLKTMEGLKLIDFLKDFFTAWGNFKTFLNISV